MSASPGRETAFTFACEGDALAGVLHEPAAPASVGMVLIVGGPQYRVGSHRQFVLMARHLAGCGVATLRFDYRGMGDAEGAPRDFESVSQDVSTAIDELCRRQPSVRRVVLWGLCDGASAALMHVRARPDPRVAGLCLVNPWARTPAGLARTHLRHYYVSRLMDRSFWSKLLKGGLRTAWFTDLLGTLRLAKSGAAAGPAAAPDFLREMALACQQYRGRMLVVCSGEDLTAKEFQQAVAADPAWSAALRGDRVEQADIPGADHTLSGPGEQDRLNATVARWLSGLVAATGSETR